MPRNGETNPKFGVYRTLCCGQEIILRQGLSFPNCPNHPSLTTIWKATVDDNIVRLGKSRSSECVMPRFHVGDQVIFVGPGAHRGKQANVVAVIEGRITYTVTTFDYMMERSFDVSGLSCNYSTRPHLKAREESEEDRFHYSNLPYPSPYSLDTFRSGSTTEVKAR